ncbi:hypothetical protein F5J12DRAFT_721271 [Pisolithus orientalis]|uniref:uncharacterized protein n=1 Tax=Pisolithus orientalis TaxID=936130 RepID=UPI0022248121|nr:uncharacterized protein F5J12DRAFT_721271 [Pisolithus orientalis]KAI6006193.1 hypothetical protein F5J12DRAFT_721271 [Pisolithus orientalis]
MLVYFTLFLYLSLLITHESRSTRNCRIEHLWVEVGSQFTRCWCTFFTQLECIHLLDVNNASHIWSLHILFLNNINHDCQVFREEWNCHPIDGPSANNKSPKDMCLLGQIKFGVYQDHEDHEELEGLGLADDEVMDMADVIARQQQVHINHEAMHVPSLRNPFRSDEDKLIFFSGLHEVIAQDITPESFGLMPVEWGSDGYLTIESIRIG